MTVLPDDTLLAWARAEQGRYAGSIRLLVASTPDEFVEAVEKVLADAADKLERSARRGWEKRGEDELRDQLLDKIDACGVDATAEPFHKGHVDFIIQHRHHRTLRYLGECKKWRAVDWHMKGLDQLVNRYHTGGHQGAALVAFAFVQDIEGSFKELRNKLDKEKPVEQQGGCVLHTKLPTAFYTTHKHDRGTLVKVLHVGCHLFVRPVKA